MCIRDRFGSDYFAESKFTYSRDISYNEWYNTGTQNYIRSRTDKEKKKKLILTLLMTKP